MRLTALATIDLTDPNSQQKQLELFESLRDDPQALQEACVQLCQDGAHTKPQTCFFLLLIVEHNLKKRGEPWPGIKESLQRFAQTGSDQPPFLANKTAQVLALAFVDLYPAKWPDFFQSLIQSGPDIFLRTLSQIDGEVVNRQINHSKSDLDRNTKLKDEMREKDVVQLVDAWMGILDGVKSGSISNDIGEVCLEVVGQYVEWIDINLIVNDNFMAYLFFLLKRDELTDSVCECMCEIVQKGMPPKEKCLLVESLYNALNETGLFQVESEDHFEAVAKLVSALGSELVFQNEKLAKDENPELIKIGKDAMLAAEAKLQLAIKFLRNDDNDVAMETIQFIQQYLDRIRHSGQQISSDILHAIMDATVTKFRYPDNYNFDSNGLDEAECDEFMNDLKQLFESICLVQPLVAIQMVTSRVNQLNDQMSHLDAECTIRMLYNLGECLPTEMGPISFKADNKSELQNLVGVFVQKSVPTHHAVVRLSLETLVRYDKYFMFDKSYLGPVIKFMVGQGGLMHQHGTVRSRAAYLFSRFVREMTPALSQYASELLQTLQNCLYQGGEDFLSESDRSFVFEAAGYLVNVSPLSPEEKHQLYASMIAPLVKRFQDDLELLSKETDPEIQSAIATRASQYVSWCGRTTKCWKGPETVQSCQAGPILAECVRVFMNALDLPHTVNDRSLILQSIRTFLHRMLICLSSDILVLLPSALSSFLRGVQYKDLHDLFPLINQIASKFKNGAFDVLSQGLLELFQATFPLMCTGETEEDKIMKRDFFGFLNTICNCQLTGILISPQNQGQLGDVIKQLHSGATGSDPVAAKLCFMVFTKLSKEWVNQFTEFGMVVKDTIIPSCFLGPSSPHFDLKDAQCQMAIVESANCMKELFNLSGEGLVIYLRDEYMRQSLQCNNEIIDEYLQALTSKDIKGTEMEIISYSKIVNELKQACTLEPDCAAVVFDSSTGELVAWSGHKSNQEAVSTAAALFGLWNSQSETAGQHDDTLEILIMKTQDRLNCMAQVIAPPVSKGYYGGTCTLAIQGSNDIQLGALKVKRILFLRSGTDDSYEKASRDLGFESHTINPIQKEFINIDKLAKVMAALEFDALVFTSQTSVEALARMNPQELPLTLPVYVVGKATAQCARNLGFKNVIGEKSGSSKNLATVILSENKTQSRFLFPGASKLIGGLKEPLETAGHHLEIIPVYQTTSRAQNDLQDEINQIDLVDVAVYFSPSGVDSIHHLISNRWPNIRTIAIGQSTAKSLPADKCEIAPSPDLEGVIHCLAQIEL